MSRPLKAIFEVVVAGNAVVAKLELKQPVPKPVTPSLKGE